MPRCTAMHESRTTADRGAGASTQRCRRRPSAAWRAVHALVFLIAIPGCSGGYQAAEERLRAESLRHQDEDMARYEAETARLRAEILKRFDRDQDGTLSRREEEAYEAYVAKVRSGQVANPFAAIVSPGADPP